VPSRRCGFAAAVCGEFRRQAAEIAAKLTAAKADLNQAKDISSAGFFVSSGLPRSGINSAGKKQGRTVNSLIQFKGTASL
jgi:hypothetical protein